MPSRDYVSACLCYEKHLLKESSHAMLTLGRLWRLDHPSSVLAVALRLFCTTVIAIALVRFRFHLRRDTIAREITLIFFQASETPQHGVQSSFNMMSASQYRTVFPGKRLCRSIPCWTKFPVRHPSSPFALMFFSKAVAEKGVGGCVSWRSQGACDELL